MLEISLRLRHGRSLLFEALCLSLLLGMAAVSVALAAPPMQVGPQFYEPPHTPEAPDTELATFLRQPLPLAAQLAAAIDAQPMQLQSIADWNRASGQPVQNGFVRPLPPGLGLRLGAESRLLFTELASPQAFAGGLLGASRAGDTLWAARVEVAGAWRLRLQLAGLQLPAGTRLWVAGRKGLLAGPFGVELMSPDGRLWTPSVAGDQLRLLVSLPGAMPDAGFALAAVGEMFELDTSGVPAPLRSEAGSNACHRDAWCAESDDWAGLDLARSAVARINYIKFGALRVCSAGLVADSDPDTSIPYLLTANHCVDSQEIASTVEAWWDYASGACNGAAPDPETLPVSVGAQLLATAEAGDFSLLQLHYLPGPRWFLGWDRSREAATDGTLLYRISHPQGRPQSFSVSRVGADDFQCPSWPRQSSIYQTQLSGLIAGGSSGAPVLNEQAMLLGQASGLCGLNATQTCKLDNALIDGAFSSYWPQVAQWLGAACRYEFLQPQLGGQHARGEDVDIRWSSSGDNCGQNVKLRLLHDGELVGVMSRGTENNGHFRWSIPAGRSPSDRYALSLLDTDQPEREAWTGPEFSIVEPLAGPGCRFEWVAPAAGAEVARGAGTLLQWSSDGANCDAPVRLRLLRDGQLVGVVVRSTANDGEHTWQVPGGWAPGSSYQLSVVSTLDENQAASSGLFTITQPRP
jgi:hypothetical protein